MTERAQRRAQEVRERSSTPLCSDCEPVNGWPAQPATIRSRHDGQLVCRDCEIARNVTVRIESDLRLRAEVLPALAEELGIPIEKMNEAFRAANARVRETLA